MLYGYIGVKNEQIVRNDSPVWKKHCTIHSITGKSVNIAQILYTELGYFEKQDNAMGHGMGYALLHCSHAIPFN